MFSTSSNNKKEKRACQVRVFGQVQGVLFRRFLVEKAHALSLTGWVANASEVNRLDCFVQGSADKVEQFLAACAVGPRLARVERVEVEEKKYNETLKSFEINGNS